MGMLHKKLINLRGTLVKYLNNYLTIFILTLLYLMLSSPAALAAESVSFGFWPANTDPTTGYEPNWTVLTHVANLDWNINADGTLVGKDTNTDSHNTIIASKAKSNDVKFLIGIGTERTNSDSVLAYHQDEFAQNIANKIKSTGAEGVILDLEYPFEVNSYTGTSNTPLLESTMKKIYTKVKAINSSYTVSLCTPPYFDENTICFKNNNLSNYMDFVFVMGYDYYWNGPTGANSPFYDDSTRYGLRYSVAEQSACYGKDKVVYGVPLYAYEYTTNSNLPGASITSANQVLLKNVNPSAYGRKWDSDSNTPYYYYLSNGVYHQIWYDDEESLALKYKYLKNQGMRGIGFWALGYEGSSSSIWNMFSGQSDIQSPQLPVASFSGSPISGNVPLIVQFNDTSTNVPTSWKWSFGDGSTNSTSQNPTHSYSKAGNYTVVLTVSNSAGSNAVAKSNYIKVTATTTTQKPVASFSSNVSSGTAPLSVAFKDTSTNTPTSWKWSFGDGTYSTAQNPIHKYSNAGNYTVTLTVNNSAGNTTVTKSNYIKVTAITTIQKPIVSFWGSRTSGISPLTLRFTDASTNTPTAWKWSFGDGTYSTAQNPRHTYSKAGNYTVTLTASNKAGSGTKTRSNYIKVK